MEKKRSGFAFWLLVWGLGLAGQICWNMENQWFNTFVYAKIGMYPSIITGMLICSAAATTFATFFFGTWADRTGKRRTFVSVGYILWGIFTIAFGLTEFLPKELYTFVAVMVVMADTVMSFFGSMGNDAGFNTWINDSMEKHNKGQLGAAMATQPVLGTLLGTVVGGILVGSDDNYMRLFIVMGVFVIVVGIISIFAMGKEDDIAPNKEGSFWHQFISVFSFRKFFQIPQLVRVSIAVSIFFIGFNCFFAYMGNYIIYYLGYTADQMGIIEAIPLVLSMFIAIPVGTLLNKNKHPWIGIVSVVVSVLGLLLIFPITPEDVDTSSLFNLRLWAGIFIVGMGYIAFLQTTKVWSKQLYPPESRGQFEGIWILFFVLIPMVGGSILGEAIVKTSGMSFINETSGQMEYIPNGMVFLVGAMVMVLTLIPLLTTIKPHKEQIAEVK